MMPNWCANSFEVTGDSQRIQAFYDFLEERKGANWFDFFVEPADENADDWYNYNLENYGCKWNCEAMDWSIQKVDDDLDRSMVRVFFDSPWGPPIKLYETLSEDESLNVYAEYNEEGMGFVGRFEDGEDECYEYDGLDSLDDVPEELVENWNIRENLQNWEDMEEKDREEIDIDKLQEEFDQMKGDENGKNSS